VSFGKLYRLEILTIKSKIYLSFALNNLGRCREIKEYWRCVLNFNG
jgi:hypothetical protein